LMVSLGLEATEIIFFNTDHFGASGCTFQALRFSVPNVSAIP
jgi:hypothetical protein